MDILELLTNPRVRQWLPNILNIGMLLLLTARLAQWSCFFAKPSMPPLFRAPSAPPPQANTFSVQPLLAAHLFGQASQELAGGQVDNLPLSSLNLVLNGVIASVNGGYALISANGQPQESFAIGQSISGGAVLHAVYPDRVVIQRNGALESLILEGEDKSAPNQWAAPTPAASAPNRPAMSSNGNVVEETSPNHYVVQRDQLAAQMRTPEFLSQATMAPASNGGFLVRTMQPGSIYQKLGLRPGDVIRTVNGQAINSAEDAMRLYQQVANLSSVQIEVLRGGKPEYLNYDFSQN
ncbi:MAG: PDZ domain-containing protein [Gammaproteobacteria bacterium]|nr:PDZ domain-containing protein [Gammaproteobacteria bacterium]